MGDLNPFERKVYAFYTMLLNAYRDEEDVEPAMPKLSMKPGGDLTEDLTAMMFAIRLFCEQFCPETVKDMDMIDFSYMFNRLAIQHTFSNAMDKVDILGEDK